MLKAIHAQEICNKTQRKADFVVTEWRKQRMNRVADPVEKHAGETRSYYPSRTHHWGKIHVNKPLERSINAVLREICRRARVVGTFPDGQSCLNLAAPD